MRDLRLRSFEARAQVALQIVRLACVASNLSVLTRAQAGHFDPTFGTGGIFTSSFGGPNTTVNAMALQSDGKIVVAGGRGPGGKAGLARITTAGAFDTSFGAGGVNCRCGGYNRPGFFSGPA